MKGSIFSVKRGSIYIVNQQLVKEELVYEKPKVVTTEADMENSVESADGAFIGVVAVSIIAAYYGKHCP